MKVRFAPKGPGSTGHAHPGPGKAAAPAADAAAAFGAALGDALTSKPDSIRPEAARRAASKDEPEPARKAVSKDEPEPAHETVFRPGDAHGAVPSVRPEPARRAVPKDEPAPVRGAVSRPDEAYAAVPSVRPELARRAVSKDEPAPVRGAVPLPAPPSGIDVGGALLRSAAHLRVDAGVLGAVDLHLRLHDGALHLRVGGDAAHLVEARAGELTQALASQGLKLASIELPKPDGASLPGNPGDPREGRRQGWDEAANAREGAERAPRTSPAGPKTTVTRGSSIDLQA